MSNVPESRHDFETESACSADQLTQRNVEAIRELEEAVHEERTRSDRVAEAIANFCGTKPQLLVRQIKAREEG